MTTALAIADRLDLLPPSAVGHERLGQVLREAALLRRLLRLSARAEEERRRRLELAANEAR
jgi:hypothetical protein